MNTHNTPPYLVSTLERELEKLKVDKDFVKNIGVFHTDNTKNSGSCDPVTKNGKMLGVKITLQEKSERNSKGSIFHEAKHAEQYFKKGRMDVDDINPVYNELEAYVYGFRRVIEEDLKAVYRKLKDLLIA